MEENNLTGAFSNEIISTTIDLTTDYSELVMDEFLVDGVLKEIPFIKTIYGIGKIGWSIRERFFVKKLFVFLQEFHSGKIDEKKLNEFKTKLEKDVKYKNKVTEQVMIFTDSFLTVEKSKILAKLLKSHIEGKFEWEHFLHLSVCLNSIHPKVFPFLEKLSHHNFTIAEDPKHRGLERDVENETLLSASGIAYQFSAWSSGFSIAQIGKDLYNFGIK